MNSIALDIQLTELRELIDTKASAHQKAAWLIPEFLTRLAFALDGIAQVAGQSHREEAGCLLARAIKTFSLLGVEDEGMSRLRFGARVYELDVLIQGILKSEINRVKKEARASNLTHTRGYCGVCLKRRYVWLTKWQAGPCPACLKVVA